MKEREDRYMAVIENHILNGANANILMKRKHRYAVQVNSTRMDGANNCHV